jgi:ankyrin repeat protein
MYLAAKKQKDLYLEFVAAGADDSIPDAAGKTPKHMAIQNGIIRAD